MKKAVTPDLLDSIDRLLEDQHWPVEYWNSVERNGRLHTAEEILDQGEDLEDLRRFVFSDGRDAGHELDFASVFSRPMAELVEQPDVTPWRGLAEWEDLAEIWADSGRKEARRCWRDQFPGSRTSCADWGVLPLGLCPEHHHEITGGLPHELGGNAPCPPKWKFVYLGSEDA